MVNSCVHSSPLPFFVEAYSDILNTGLCGLLQCAEVSEDEILREECLCYIWPNMVLVSKLLTYCHTGLSAFSDQ
jgi:hypothetical protein